MANKKFKVAILGAPGVGKTVFLGSYFNIVTNLRQGKPVTFKTASASREAGRIIETLFKRQVPVEKKIDPEAVPFSVDSLNMDLELFQVPGGISGGKYDWEASPTLTRLESAGGVVFFISAEDLVRRPEKTLQENKAFIKALSFIFENNSSRWGEEETPVVFLFTKGDSVPEATAEELAAKMTALFTPEIKEGSPLSDYLSGSANALKAYKVIAIGKWPDSATLPKAYEPQNVIKPMEELYQTMNSISKARKELKSIIIAIAVLLVAASAGTWSLDLRGWSRAKGEIDALAGASRFDEALKIVDSYEGGYIFPDPLPLVPSALRGGADKERVRAGILKAYEKAEFKALQPLLEGLDPDRMPDVRSDQYLETAARVEKFLANPEFEKVGKENFEKVRSVAWYFEAGQALLGKAAPAVEGGAADTDEAFGFIERWLEYMPKLPEQWKKDGAGKAGELFASWAEMLNPAAGIEEVEAFIASAEKLSLNPAATEELKKLSFEKACSWKTLLAEKWTARGAEWIAEAGALPAREAVPVLSARLKGPDLPDSVRKSLEEALDKQYALLAEALAADEKAGIAEIKKVLSQFPEMPHAPRQTLKDRIVAIARDEAAKIAGEIGRTESLEALVGRMDDLKLTWEDFPEGAGEIALSFEKTLSSLLSAEWKMIDENAAALTEKSDFAAAKELYTVSLAAVSERIEKAGLGEMSAAALSEAKNLLDGKIEGLKAGNTEECKKAFEALKAARDSGEITPVIEKLSAFEALWAGSDEAAEAQKAAAFLKAVQQGARASLTVVGGDFTGADSLWGAPNVKVIVRKDGAQVLQTQTAKGQVKPAFGEKFEFTWDVSSVLTFAAIEEGGLFSSEKEILNVSVDASGIMGYQKLSGTLKAGDNSLTVKLEADLPESPWN